MQCRDFREIADSYLADELLIETNHDMIRHLGSCADCRRELTARRELRSKLRTGFQQEPELQMRAEFAASLHDKLRTAALRPSASAFRILGVRRAAYIAIAASVVIVAAFGFRAMQQRSVTQSSVAREAGRETPTPGESQPQNPGSHAALVNPLSALFAENALGNHRDCAINHRLKEKPIDLDEAGRSYDRAYINLAQAVMSDGQLPAGATLVAAHSCIFNEQRFGHVILKYHDQLVSVLVTTLDGAEASDQNALGASKEESISS
ncbi:MAG: zf-HC2 domain-containing protein, partial [Acidobacteriota bacterium]|nr:zf-HC2 domain-containing protein [Acidobacteriota bacterium]